MASEEERKRKGGSVSEKARRRVDEERAEKRIRTGDGQVGHSSRVSEGKLSSSCSKKKNKVAGTGGKGREERSAEEVDVPRRILDLTRTTEAKTHKEGTRFGCRPEQGILDKVRWQR